MYSAIRDELVEQGMDPAAIRFIHDARTAEDLATLRTIPGVGLPVPAHGSFGAGVDGVEMVLAVAAGAVLPAIFGQRRLRHLFQRDAQLAERHVHELAVEAALGVDGFL